MYRSQAILLNAGGDASDEFHSIHSKKAHKMLQQYFIGEIAKGTAAAPLGQKPESAGGEDGKGGDTAPRGPPRALRAGRRKVTLKLADKKVVTHDTR
ncbi:unnamed protein product, partial [Phaeothamnion confervicola]